MVWKVSRVSITFLQHKYFVDKHIGFRGFGGFGGFEGFGGLRVFLRFSILKFENVINRKKTKEVCRV